MTDDRTPEEQIIDEAFAPPGFPTETDFGLDQPGALRALGDDAAAQLRQQFEDARAGWRIDGENTAAWAVSKLARAQARYAEACAVADALVAKAEQYRASVEALVGHDVDFFTGKLREWYAEVGGEGRTKTRRVLGGELSATVGGVSCVLPDDDDELLELADWLGAHGHGDAVEYPRPSIKKAELAVYQGKVDKQAPGDYPAVDAETGEVVPGVTFRRGTPTFRVKLTEPAPTPEGDAQ